MEILSLSSLIALCTLGIALVTWKTPSEQKKSKRIFLISGAIFFISLIDNCNQSKRNSSNEATIKRLDSNVTSLKNQQKFEGKNEREFRLQLLQKFNIKDSQHIPIYINNGKQVNVNDNHGKLNVSM